MKGPIESQSPTAGPALPILPHEPRGILAAVSLCLAGESTFGFSPGLSWKGLCSRLAAVLAGKEEREKPSSGGPAARQDTWAFSPSATVNDGKKFHYHSREAGATTKQGGKTLGPWHQISDLASQCHHP